MIPATSTAIILSSTGGTVYGKFCVILPMKKEAVLERDLACVVQARLGSERVKQKMIRPFAGSCLLEILLLKLKKSRRLTPERIYLSGFEPEILAIGEKTGMQVYRRSYESTLEPVTTQVLFGFIRDISSEYFLTINACNPLLSIETIDRAIEAFQSGSMSSLFSVVRRKNFYFNEAGEMINDFDGLEKYKRVLETKMLRPVFEAAHSIYIWSAKSVVEEDSIFKFKPNDPYLFEIPEEEYFDIDYEYQFRIAELAYQARSNK